MCLAGCYSLSVRRGERAAWASVTHYRIHRLDNGWLYISPRLTFPSLHNLVDHYSGNALPAPSTLSCVWGDSYALKGGRGKRWQLVPPRPGAPRLGGQGVHPIDAAGSLPRVQRGALLPPQRALLHGRAKGGPSLHTTCCHQEAIAPLG